MLESMLVILSGVEKNEDIPHWGGGAQIKSLNVQKNDKITRTILILK